MLHILFYEQMLLLFYQQMFHVLLFFLFIGIFIFGMAVLRSGLIAATNTSFKKSITASSHSIWKGILAGMKTTFIMQNSSVVMVIKFISARMVSLFGSIGILAGTHLGTSMILVGLTLNLDWFILPILLIGGVFLLMNNPKVKSGGRIFVGLALVYGAIWVFEYLALPLQALDIIHELIQGISTHHLYALLAGVMIVGSVQSSYATLGIVIGFLSAGIMDVSTGVAIMLGANLGRCIDVLYTGFVARGREARLAASAYTLITVIGVCLFYHFIDFLAMCAGYLSKHPDLQLAYISLIISLITTLLVIVNPKVDHVAHVKVDHPLVISNMSL